MEKIFESFTITILRLYKLIQKIKTYEMKEYGLKSIHVMCIYFLNEYADGLTVSELTRMTLSDKAAISRAIQLLEGNGFIRNGSKKHNSVICLTDEGKKLAAYIDERAESAVNAGKVDFTDMERDAFYGSLNHIADSLQSYYNSLIDKV